MRPSTWSAASYVLFALMLVAWAANYLFVRVGEHYVAPLWLATLRAALGAGGIAVFLLLRPADRSLTAREKRDALLLGIPNTGIFLALWFVAAPAILPGTTSVIVYTFPLWVALFSPWVLGSRLTGGHWAAIGTGFAGVLLVSEPWTGGSHAAALRPVLELLGAAISWAVATVAIQRRFEPAALPSANGYQMLGGAIFLLAVTSAVGQLGLPGTAPDFWIAVLWLGLFGTAFAYGVWFYLLRTVHASTLSAYSFLVPLLALALSVVFDGERLAAVQVGGVLLVLLGIYLVGRRPLPAPAHPADGASPAASDRAPTGRDP